MLHNLFVHNIIHQLKSFDSFFLCDPNKLLFKRHRSEAVVKEKQSLLRVNAKKRRHVFIVRQSGTETNQSHVFLCRLYVPNGPDKSNDTFLPLLCL